MEVCWSPLHEDKFYSLGTNLNLYKVYNSPLSLSTNDVQEKDMRLSDDTKASLLCTRNRFQCRCIAWRPHLDPDQLLSIGLNNGKVLLSSFGKGRISDPHSLVAQEFILKHSRPCNYLEWNKNEPFLLAEVTEKLKTDACILIWDVRYPNNQSAFDNHKLTNHGDLTQSANYSRPYVEIGVNESCSSFSWLSSNARSFVCGMNLKNLRIYDIRIPAEQSRPQHSASTRAISLISVNPSFEHRIASAYENQLFIWDTRKFNEPYDSIIEKMNFSRFSWCPTKSGVLGCSFIDSPIFKLYDMSYSSGENNEHFKIEKILKPTLSSGHDDNISCFSWHPTHTTRLLLATTSGRITDFTANNRIAMAWSPDLTLTSCINNELVICKAGSICSQLENDVSVRIRRRAVKQYGIKTQIADNLAFVAGDEKLCKIWTWLSSIKSEHCPPNVQPPSPLVGTSHLLSQSGLRNSTYAHLPTIESSSGLHLSLSSTNHNHSLPQSPTVPHLPSLPPPTHTPGGHPVNYQGNQGAGFHQSINQPMNITFSQSIQRTMTQSFNTPSNLSLRLSGILNIFHRSCNLTLRQSQASIISYDWKSGDVVVSPTRDVVISPTRDVVISPTRDVVISPTRDNPSHFSTAGIKGRNQIYKSEERILAIELCGWKFPSQSTSLPLIDKLDHDNDFTRAAAINVFNIRLKEALDLLKRGGNINNQDGRETSAAAGSDLNMVAMALSGFHGNSKGGFWGEMCAQLIPALHDPYLKALFSFLSSEDASFECIVNDQDLELTDRIAFACLHLPDKMLLDFLERLSDKFIEEGDPLGLILTGFTGNGVKLLGNYVDRSSDVQSAVLLLLQALPEMEELRGNGRLQGWVDDYRELLDQMGLWMERAEFDVFRMRVERTCEKTRQIHISCTFCNKPIVVDPKNNRTRTTSTNVGGNVKPRIQSCPHCRKPLPRCSVCMLFMGTASGIGCPKTYKATVKNERKMSRINDWFTWCQRCLHGGHAGHMVEWFKSRSECPINGCNCRCDQLDAFSKRDLISRDQRDDGDDNDADNNVNNNDENGKNINNNNNNNNLTFNISNGNHGNIISTDNDNNKNNNNDNKEGSNDGGLRGGEGHSKWTRQSGAERVDRIKSANDFRIFSR